MRKFHAGAGPTSRNEGVVEYLPSKKKLLYVYGQTVYFYDYAQHLWTSSSARFPDNSYDYLGCHDTKRDRVYVAKNTGFWYYDVQADTWTTLSAANQPNVGASTWGCYHYDSVNDVIIAFVTSTSAPARGVFVYDIDANAWSQADTILSHSGSCHNGTYDPDLNAHFIFNAGDSYDNGTMLVYRYKKAPSAVRKNRARPVLPVLEASPNPFRSSVRISAPAAVPIRIFDTRGKAVAAFEGRGEILWNAGALPSGVYLLKADFGKKTLAKKLFLNK
jgi:hypothetical protein